jgi:hypothetical protein
LDILSLLLDLSIVVILAELEVRLIHNSLIVSGPAEPNAYENILDPDDVTHSMASFRAVAADGSEHDGNLQSKEQESQFNKLFQLIGVIFALLNCFIHLCNNTCTQHGYSSFETLDDLFNLLTFLIILIFAVDQDFSNS